MTTHSYQVTVQWTGNKGLGTLAYDQYDRAHTINIHGKPEITASSDTPFRGDSTKHNPEDMLVASLSACHMLWYLHLCADAGVNVVEYLDTATGILAMAPTGGHFSEVSLQPVVVVSDESMIAMAIELHELAHKKCFIANSVNFPVICKPLCRAKNSNTHTFQ